MDLGKKIYEGLKKKDMSQSKLAEKLGIKQPSVGKWISGKSSPTAENLIEIIRILDLVEEFFPGHRKVSDIEKKFPGDDIDSMEEKIALIEKRLALLENADSEK